jgi:primosomal protein N' (replication factor Y)
LAKLFPSARIARFDTDNKKVERIDARHGEITGGGIDILVGTQILTKGHDLPNLGLVAMLIAESGLNFPDYTAEERAFQAIRQLAGRVGRGHRDGKVILQSFNPASTLLSQAIKSDYGSFYKSQIEERKAYGFPPFWHVMKISSPRASSASSLKSAEKILAQIKDNHPDCVILGPSPAFYFKKNGKYNWQLIVKSKQRTSLSAIMNELPGNHVANIDPMNLL